MPANSNGALLLYWVFLCLRIKLCQENRKYFMLLMLLTSSYCWWLHEGIFSYNSGSLSPSLLFCQTPASFKFFRYTGSSLAVLQTRNLTFKSTFRHGGPHGVTDWAPISTIWPFLEGSGLTAVCKKLANLFRFWRRLVLVRRWPRLKHKDYK